MKNENPAPERLSQELMEITTLFDEQDFTIGEFVERLQGRVYILVLVFFSLPFCQPIALPGLSMPFGLVLALFGLRFALRREPWLPKWVLKIKIPRKIFARILRAGAWLLRGLEKLLHPRMTRIFNYRSTQFISGMVIFICGVLLLLPLPIPLTNNFPAIAILLIAASLSERDGLGLIAGGIAFLITLAFFGLLLVVGVEAVYWLQSHFGGPFKSPD